MIVLPKSNLEHSRTIMENIHFAIAGLLTTICISLVIVGQIAAAQAPLKYYDWAILLLGDGSVLFSICCSVRMVRRKNFLGWIFLGGNSIYALLMIAIQIAQFR